MPATDVTRTPQVALSALGVPIEVRCAGPRALELADAIRSAWSRCVPGRAGAGAADGPVDVLDVHLAEAGAPEPPPAGGLVDTDLPRLLETMASAITQRVIDVRSPELLCLHAAALGTPGGGPALLLVGQSGAGKTTAATALGRHLDLVTDETAAMSDDFELTPFPRPLGLKEPGLAVKRQASPDELGLGSDRGAYVVADVWFLQRCDDAPRVPELERADLLEALTLLVPQSSYLSRRPEPLQDLRRLLAHVGGGRLVRYRDALDLVPVARDLLGVAP